MVVCFEQRIEDEIAEKQKKMNYLDQSALFLIQKGDGMDAIRVQSELEDFKKYARSVFGRVHKYQAKLQRITDAQVRPSECVQNV